MSILAAMAVGAGVSALGGLANTGLSFGLNQYSSKKAAKNAYKYWRQSQLEGPSLQRQGLEKAGYNPLLALNQGSASFNQGVSAPTTQVGDIVGSAKQGAELAKEAVKAADATIDNVEADTKLKESQLGVFDAQKARLEAETSLAISQAERSDLAYGRDIVDTITGIAGTGASLYSAKAMSDVAKANSAIAARNATVNERNATVNERKANTQTYEVRRDAKGRKVGEIQRSTRASGIPSVSNSANPNVKPNAVSQVGSSARFAGRIAGDIARMIVLPAAVAGLAADGVMPFVEEGKSQSRKDIERNVRKHPIQYRDKKGRSNFVPRFGY